MENKKLLHKYEKASKYSKEKDIYTLNNIEVSMRSKHSNRIISYNALSSKWKCTCEFYAKENICSHILALQKKLDIIFSQNFFKELNNDDPK